jgi:hypothetical protein
VTVAEPPGPAPRHPSSGHRTSSCQSGVPELTLRATESIRLLYARLVSLGGVMPATLTIRPIEEGRYRGRRRGLAVGPLPAWTTETTGHKDRATAD